MAGVWKGREREFQAWEKHEGRGARGTVVRPPSSHLKLPFPSLSNATQAATQASVNSWRATYYIMLDYMSLLRNTSSFIHSSAFICSPVTPFTYWLFHSAFYSHNYWSVSQLFIYLASNMSHLGLSNLKDYWFKI